ncbi:MAG: hypothetical protein JO080_02150 [Mucilaginibacter sp.]|nr:hypothetical protein [Mucilaginibacter sp.]
MDFLRNLPAANAFKTYRRFLAKACISFTHPSHKWDGNEFTSYFTIHCRLALATGSERRLDGFSQKISVIKVVFLSINYPNNKIQ